MSPMYGHLPCKNVPYVCTRHNHGVSPPSVPPDRSKAFNQTKTILNRSKETSDVGTKRSPFSELPTELVLQTLAYLDPVSLACLALCNKALLQLIGPTTWKNLKTGRTSWQSEHELEKFLKILRRDLDGYWFCHLHHLVRPRYLLATERCCINIAKSEKGLRLWKKNVFPRRPKLEAGAWRERDPYEMHTILYRPSLLHLHQILHHGLCTDTLSCSGSWVLPIDQDGNPIRPNPQKSNKKRRTSRAFDDFPFINADPKQQQGDFISLCHQASGEVSRKGNLRMKMRYKFEKHGDFNLMKAILGLKFPLCRHVIISNEDEEDISKDCPREGSGNQSGVLPSAEVRLNGHIPEKPDLKNYKFRTRVPISAKSERTRRCCDYCRTEYIVLRRVPRGEFEYADIGFEIIVWQTIHPYELTGMIMSIPTMADDKKRFGVSLRLPGRRIEWRLPRQKPSRAAFLARELETSEETETPPTIRVTRRVIAL